MDAGGRGRRADADPAEGGRARPRPRSGRGAARAAVAAGASRPRPKRTRRRTATAARTTTDDADEADDGEAAEPDEDGRRAGWRTAPSRRSRAEAGAAPPGAAHPRARSIPMTAPPSAEVIHEAVADVGADEPTTLDEPVDDGRRRSGVAARRGRDAAVAPKKRTRRGSRGGRNRRKKPAAGGCSARPDRRRPMPARRDRDGGEVARSRPSRRARSPGGDDSTARTSPATPAADAGRSRLRGRRAASRPEPTTIRATCRCPSGSTTSTADDAPVRYTPSARGRLPAFPASESTSA